MSTSRNEALEVEASTFFLGRYFVGGKLPFAVRPGGSWRLGTSHWGLGRSVAIVASGRPNGPNRASLFLLVYRVRWRPPGPNGTKRIVIDAAHLAPSRGIDRRARHANDRPPSAGTGRHLLAV